MPYIRVIGKGNPARLMETKMAYQTRTTKQSWEIGALVKVGFLTLRIVEKIATPGDYRPDLFVMSSADGSRFYQFTPHHGVIRCESLADARNW